MRQIPTALIMLPLLVSMVTFFIRFLRLDPEENTRNPNFIAGALCLGLMLTYVIGIQALMGGSVIASLFYFVAAIVLSAAAIRAMFQMRGRL